VQLGTLHLEQLSAQYVIYKLKLDEENTKIAGLAQQNGFGPGILAQFSWGLAQQNSCRRRVQ
jgi:hypothetical protein